MRFMMMTNATKDSEAGIPPNPALMAAVGNLTMEMAKAGKLESVGGLLPSSSGAMLRLSQGRVTVTDGPFTEAKELIGGFAIVQVQSKEEAIELGRRFLAIHAEVLGPSHEMASEIRQMYDPSDEGPARP